MKKERKKHRVEVEVTDLHKVPVKPPRKKLWDRVPTWLAMKLLDLFPTWNPKPTPYERWMIENAALRQVFAQMLAVKSYQGLAGMMPTTPEKKEWLN